MATTRRTGASKMARKTLDRAVPGAEVERRVTNDGVPRIGASRTPRASASGAFSGARYRALAADCGTADCRRFEDGPAGSLPRGSGRGSRISRRERRSAVDGASVAETVVDGVVAGVEVGLCVVSDRVSGSASQWYVQRPRHARERASGTWRTFRASGVREDRSRWTVREISRWAIAG